MSERIKKALGYLRGLLLRRKLNVSGLICSFGRTRVYRSNGDIEVGDRTCLWPGVLLASSGQIPGRRAKLTIGSRSSIGDRTQIHCGNQVSIGDYVLIAWDVNIIEFEHHTLGNVPPDPKPIRIEDEVWIGCQAIILKGVTIGKGSTVGAGAVVVKDVPPYTFVAGNPAKVIKQTPSWRGSSAQTENLRQETN